MGKSVKSEKKDKRILFSIGFKLAVIIGLIVVLSLGAVTFVVSYFVTDSTRITAEDNNLTLNTRAASAAESELKTIEANVFQLLDLITVVGGNANAAIRNQAQAFFFERNENIASILLFSKGQTTADFRLVNNKFFLANEISSDLIEDFIQICHEDIDRGAEGVVSARNASVVFQLPMMALLLPWKENGWEQACLILFSSSIIENSISMGLKSVNSTFLVNHSGEILVHPDTDLVKAGVSAQNNALVIAMRENNDQDRQIVFEDEQGKKFFGAYHKLSIADIGVLTTADYDLVFEAIRQTVRFNIYLAIAILCISIVIVLIYTNFSISKPLKIQKAAATEISRGNFNSDVMNMMNMKRKDEIGVLNNGLRDEQEFLITFSKFTNQNVAKAIATKSIDFDPHLKDITIFFSDIRGFTAISDGFKNRFKENSGAEIIGFLNDYMSRMVECVELSHGNIDKFEGDAIMAVWGLMRNDDLSFEELPEGEEKNRLAKEHRMHVLEDLTNSITGTIAMRYALMKYNKDAEIFTKAHEGEALAKYKPHVRIGCGINAGRASVGLMGSKDKMEYTSIGDPVNFASRTEASNKPCGTDILITEDAYNLLKNEYIRTEEGGFNIPKENEAKEIIVEKIPVSFEVKGKGEQHFFGVVNMPNFDIEAFFKQGNENFTIDEDCIRAVGKKGPKNMREVRELLGIPIPDFDKVNLNEEENKIQVKQ